MAQISFHLFILIITFLSANKGSPQKVSKAILPRLGSFKLHQNLYSFFKHYQHAHLAINPPQGFIRRQHPSNSLCTTDGFTKSLRYQEKFFNYVKNNIYSNPSNILSLLGQSGSEISLNNKGDSTFDHTSFIETLERISKSVPETYSEQQSFKDIQISRNLNNLKYTRSLLNFNKFLRSYRIRNLSTRLLNQLSELKNKLNTNKISLLPYTDKELEDLVDNSLHPKNNKPLWQHLSEKNNKILENKLLNQLRLIKWKPLKGSIWGFTLSYLFNSLCNSYFWPNFPISFYSSTATLTLAGCIIGCKNKKSTKAMIKRCFKDEVFGSWLFNNDVPSYNSILSYCLQFDLTELEINDLILELFIKILYSSSTKDGNYMRDLEELTSLKKKLAISFDDLPFFFDEVVARFISHYQIPRGLTTLDGSNWINTHNIRRVFIDKIIFLSSTLLSNSTTASKIAQFDHLSLLFQIDRETIEQRFLNISSGLYMENLEKELKKDPNKFNLQEFSKKTHLTNFLDETQRDVIKRKVFKSWLSNTFDENKALYNSVLNSSDQSQEIFKHINTINNLSHLLRIDKHWIEKFLEAFLFPTFELSFNSYSKDLLGGKITQDEFNSMSLNLIKTLRLSLDQIWPLILDIIKPKIVLLKKEAIKYHQLSNRPMAVFTAERILELFRGIKQFIQTISFDGNSLSQLKELFSPPNTFSNSFGPFQLIELLRNLIEDQILIGKTWNVNDLRDWCRATGINYEEIHSQRIILCKSEIEDESSKLLPIEQLRSNFSNNSRYHDSAQTGKALLSKLSIKFDLDFHLIQRICKKIYAEKLNLFKQIDGVFDKKAWDFFTKIQNFLGLPDSEAKAIHGIVLKDLYENSVWDRLELSLNPMRSTNESLPINFRIEKDHADLLKVGILSEFVRNRILESVLNSVKNIKNTKFKNKEPSNNCSQDFHANHEDEKELNNNNIKALFENCANLLNFYEDHKLLKLHCFEDKINHPEHPLRSNWSSIHSFYEYEPESWISFTLRDFISTQDKEFILNTLFNNIEDENFHDKHNHEFIPKLGLILGYTFKEQLQKLNNLGSLVFSNLLSDFLSKNNTLSSEECHILSMVSKKFSLTKEAYFTMLKKHKQDKLKTIYNEIKEYLPSSNWSENHGKQLRKAAQELNSNLVSCLNLQEPQIEDLICSELRFVLQKLCKNDQPLDTHFLDEIKSSYNFSQNNIQQLLHKVAKKEVEKIISMAIDFCYSEDYKEVAKILNYLTWYLTAFNENHFHRKLKLRIFQTVDKDDLNSLLMIHKSRPLDTASSNKVLGHNLVSRLLDQVS